jgi:hypothetical protein
MLIPLLPICVAALFGACRDVELVPRAPGHADIRTTMKYLRHLGRDADDARRDD